MNPKDLRFYELFEAFFKTDFTADRLGLQKSFKRFLDLDYQIAVDVWDYLCTTRENELTKDERLANILGFDLLNVFYTRAGQKCVKAINTIPTIRRAVYQYTKHGATETAQNILVELLVANKIIPAEELLRCLHKNTRIHYGKTIQQILERVFIELLKKNPAKIEMPRKLSDLFLSFIRRIKTDEKAMLEQRIKEINR